MAQDLCLSGAAKLTAGGSAAPVDIAETNREFYDALWSRAYLERPERFNTWPIIAPLVHSGTQRLEIGPGLRPRLPIAGTHFIDISAPVVERLNARGGLAQRAEIGAMPFPDAAFDLICACDVIEHLEDDRGTFRELSRVLKDDGVLIFSVPLGPERWTEFDDWVGHARRYRFDELRAIMSANQLTPERSGTFGMKPRGSRFVRFGMSWLKHRRREAMFWYNWLAMPIAMRLQKKIHLAEGLIHDSDRDDIILICRRLRRPEGETNFLHEQTGPQIHR